MKNLQTWSLLREASLDIGKKYTCRIFIYCSVFLAFYLAYFAFVSMALLGFLHHELPLTMYITGTYDIFLVLGIFLFMLKYGSEINEYSEVFKGIFIKQKTYLWEIKSKLDLNEERKMNGQGTFEILKDLFIKYKYDPVEREKYIDE